MPDMKEIRQEAHDAAMKSMVAEERCSPGALRAAEKLTNKVLKMVCECYGGDFERFGPEKARLGKAMARLIDRETGLPELLAACQYQADDRMDGDLLTRVAVNLLSEADYCARWGCDIEAKSKRDQADKLLKKQLLQAKALEIAEKTP